MLPAAALLLVSFTAAGAQEDCNRNGLDDRVEVEVCPSQDCDGDGVLDECAPASVYLVYNLRRADPVSRDAFATGKRGDLDGDGDDELVLVFADDSLRIMDEVGPGEASIVATHHLSGRGVHALATADFDGDGDTDLVVARDAAVTVLLNDGGFTFRERVTMPVGAGPRHLAAGDLDGDGDVDLVTTNEDNLGIDSVSVLFNAGDGALSPPVNRAGGEPVTGVALSDVDLDVDLDIVAGNGSSGILVFFNDGVGGFGERSVPDLVPFFEFSSMSRLFAAADFDGDHRDEFVIADRFARLGLLGWEGERLARRHFLGDAPRWLVVRDLDGDGDADIVSPSDFRVIEYAVNVGDGVTFQRRRFSGNFGGQVLEVADFDGDGLGDLLLGPGFSPTVVYGDWRPVRGNEPDAGAPDGCPPAGGGPAPPCATDDFIRGDVNLDRDRNISDPQAILIHLFLGGGPLQCDDAADADDDGRVAINDAAFLLRELFLGGVSPPLPGLPCGQDQTTDELTCRSGSCR